MNYYFEIVNKKGTYAIVSLMVISTLEKYNGILYPKIESESVEPAHHLDNNGTTDYDLLINSTRLHTNIIFETNHSKNFLSNDPVHARVLIATSIALLTGLLQILFGILHIGIITRYLSDSIVSGFTIG